MIIIANVLTINRDKLISILWNPGRLAYGSVWYSRFRELEQGLSRMTEVEPFEDDPAWQMLPLVRREEALKRLAALIDYEQSPVFDEYAAQKAAKAMGLTVTQFYRVRRKWTERRSIFSITPFGRPGAATNSKLEAEIYEEVHRLIIEALDAGDRLPSEILRRIYANWSLNAAAPSHMTIRRFIAEALVAFEGLPGDLRLNNGVYPQEEVEAATRYGEVVAIDHVPLSVFVAQPLRPETPVMSIAIDLFTKSILGFTMSAGKPGPRELLAVLERTEEMTASDGVEGAEAIRPRLVFACTVSRAWRPALARIADSGISARVRKTPDLHFGGIIKRLIGGSIGPVRFLNRYTKGFQRSGDALMDLEQLTALLQKGVDELNASRLANVDRRPIKFGI